MSCLNSFLVVSDKEKVKKTVENEKKWESVWLPQELAWQPINHGWSTVKLSVVQSVVSFTCCIILHWENGPMRLVGAGTSFPGDKCSHAYKIWLLWESSRRLHFVSAAWHLGKPTNSHCFTPPSASAASAKSTLESTSAVQLHSEDPFLHCSRQIKAGKSWYVSALHRFSKDLLRALLLDAFSDFSVLCKIETEAWM